MPTLNSVPQDEIFIKAYLIGDSKDGKTASLISLVEAGYHLHVLDMDNKIHPSYFTNKVSELGPEAMSRVDFVQPRDRYINSPAEGTIAATPAKAYVEAGKQLDNWTGGDEPIKLAEAGVDHVLVIDTLNLLSVAAFNQARTISPDLKNSMLWYKSAQTSIDNIIQKLWGKDFRCHVLILSHIRDIDLEYTVNNKGEKIPTKTQGFAATIGTALSKEIGKHTNELWRIKRKGFGPTAKRIIVTSTDDRTLLGSSTDLPRELPAETALREIFKSIRKTEPKGK